MQKNESAFRSNPRKVWTSITVAFLERAAFFAVAPFFVIYLHETLSLNPIASTALNGSLLWGLIVLFPLFNTRLTDYLGSKQTLSIALVSLSLGYLIMGNIPWLWPDIVGSRTAEALPIVIPVILSILLIGIGCSLARTGSARSIQESTRSRTAMGLFFLVVHTGALTGMFLSWLLRTRGLKLFSLSQGSHFIDIRPGLANGFSFIGTVLCLMSLLAILFLYREDESQNLAEPGDRRNKTESLKEIFSGISRVWKNRKIRIYFSLLAFFWILYAQIFSLIPLYLRFLDGKSPVELYIMILPITLLTFQLLISRFTEKWAPRRATITGMLLATLGILVNLIPAAFLKDPASKISLWGIDIPLGGLFILGSIMLLVTGEMILSPRMGHHLNSTGSGEAEGEAKGFANLPVVLGTVVGAPLGGILFEYFISLPRQTGQPARPVYIWSVLGILGLLSMLGMIRFHRSVLRETGAPD